MWLSAFYGRGSWGSNLWNNVPKFTHLGYLEPEPQSKKRRKREKNMVNRPHFSHSFTFLPPCWKQHLCFIPYCFSQILGEKCKEKEIIFFKISQWILGKWLWTIRKLEMPKKLGQKYTWSTMGRGLCHRSHICPEVSVVMWLQIRILELNWYNIKIFG